MLEPTAPAGTARTISAAIAAFKASLVAKSPRTAANYRSALRRFAEFLPVLGLDPATDATAALPAEVLERFYIWLLDRHGQARRATAVA